jgi:hypothetical protein
VAMKRDIRETPLYREAEALFATVRRPGTGQISDASEIHVAPDGRLAVFTGAMVETLVGTPLSRIARVDLASGETRVLTFGPNTDRCPKYSPKGAQIAFLSDRHRAGDFQLYLLEGESGAARAAARGRPTAVAFCSVSRAMARMWPVPKARSRARRRESPRPPGCHRSRRPTKLIGGDGSGSTISIPTGSVS